MLAHISFTQINRNFNDWSSNASLWAGKAINLIRSIPEYVKANPNVAIIATANALFFIAISLLANYLDERVRNAPKKLDSDERKFNQFLVNGVVVGASVMTFNVILSKVIHHKLSYLVIAAIACAQIVLRLLLNLCCCCFEANQQIEEVPVQNEPTPTTPDPIILDDEEDLIPPLEEPETVEKEETPKWVETTEPIKVNKREDEELFEVSETFGQKSETLLSTPPQQVMLDFESVLTKMSSRIFQLKAPPTPQPTQQLLVKRLCEEMSSMLEWEFGPSSNLLGDIDGTRVELVQTLQQKGAATIEGSSKFSHTVCESIQVAFETVLKKKMAHKDIKNVTVICISLLPSPSLRTPSQSIEISQAIEWEKSATTIRTNTLRSLRAAGATLYIGYSANDYQAYPATSPEAKSQSETYEKEKLSVGINDMPRQKAMSEDLLGELYIFEDKDDNRFQFIIQSRLTKPAIEIEEMIQDENGKDVKITRIEPATKEWKIYFGAVGGDPKADEQRLKMLDFIQ